jgi:hypothetical protein
MDLGTGRAGSAVFAVQDGTVERILRDEDTNRRFEGYGNGVIVNHHDGTWGLYAHLQRSLVPVGKVLRAGEQVGEVGSTSNGKFRGMGAHLHLELRRAKRDGSSPFPGPYRTYNLDPRPWLESKGVRFGSRGAIEVQPGSPAAVTRPLWTALSGLPPVYRRGIIEAAAGLSGLGDDEANEYEPPARFDRDARFGLTPTEWAAAGAGALVLTAGAAALVLRSKLKSNRKHGRRASRLRAWGT